MTNIIKEIFIKLPDLYFIIFFPLTVIAIVICIVISHHDYLLNRKQLKEKGIGYWKFMYYWYYELVLGK